MDNRSKEISYLSNDVKPETSNEFVYKPGMQGRTPAKQSSFSRIWNFLQSKNGMILLTVVIFALIGFIMVYMLLFTNSEPQTPANFNNSQSTPSPSRQTTASPSVSTSPTTTTRPSISPSASPSPSPSPSPTPSEQPTPSPTPQPTPLPGWAFFETSQIRAQHPNWQSNDAAYVSLPLAKEGTNPDTKLGVFIEPGTVATGETDNFTSLIYAIDNQNQIYTFAGYIAKVTEGNEIYTCVKISDLIIANQAAALIRCTPKEEEGNANYIEAYYIQLPNSQSVLIVSGTDKNDNYTSIKTIIDTAANNIVFK